MIPFSQAEKILFKGVKPLGAEEVALIDALGRILREDIKSPLSIPPFDKSAMDGYAIKAADIVRASKTNPVSLRVLEDIPAGKIGKRSIKKGYAARIMTGAKMPFGADAVVMVEDTESAGHSVKIYASVETGDNIAEAGEDVKKGQKILSSGIAIGPAQLGMIASTGKSKIEVGRKPVVNVISTGSEIAAPGKPLGAGKIYDANGFSLTALALENGGDAKFMGVAIDKKGALTKKIESSRDFDILVLSGGVSEGDYDFVGEELIELGVKPLFWKVAIKPGMPTFAGKFKDKYVFGLPGNPVSCMVAFELFVAPLIHRLLGKTGPGLLRGKAAIVGDVKIKPSRRKFFRAKLVLKNGKNAVVLAKNQKAGILTSMVESDALVDIPEGVTHLSDGDEVEILRLR